MADVGTEFMDDVKSIPKPLWVALAGAVVVAVFMLRKGSGASGAQMAATTYPDMGAGSQNTGGGGSGTGGGSGSGSSGDGLTSSDLVNSNAALLDAFGKIQTDQQEAWNKQIDAITGAIGGLGETEAANQNTLADLFGKLDTIQQQQQRVAANAGSVTTASHTAAGPNPGAINTDPRVGNQAGMYQGPASNVEYRSNPDDNHNTNFGDTGKIVIYDNPSFLDQASREALYQHNIASSGGG